MYSRCHFASHRVSLSFFPQAVEESRGCACAQTDNSYQNKKGSIRREKIPMKLHK